MSELRNQPAKRVGGRLNSREAADLTVRIVDVAIERFAEQGFAATTIEEIAVLCSTTPRSVIRRFPTKDDLLVATVPRFTERLKRFRTQAKVQGDALSTLRALLRSFLDIALSPELRSFHLTCVNEARRVPGLSDALAAGETMWEEELHDCFIQAQEAGFFRHHDAATLATLAIAAMLSYPYILSEMGHRRFSSAPGADIFFDQIFSTLLALSGLP
jgi:AcrR family transcriptional regulator